MPCVIIRERQRLLTRKGKESHTKDIGKCMKNFSSRERFKWFPHSFSMMTFNPKLASQHMHKKGVTRQNEIGVYLFLKMSGME